jgi:hypothetical protein
LRPISKMGLKKTGLKKMGLKLLIAVAFAARRGPPLRM